MPDAELLIFGATGALGRHLLQALVERGVSRQAITAAGRNQSRLAELRSAGFGTAAVDLSDPATVRDLVLAHRDVILISGGDSNRAEQHRSVVSIAASAHSRHLYYTSGIRADDRRFAINSDHRATEEAIRVSGVPHTILRNTWYIENYIPMLEVARRSGVLTAATGDGVVAAASRKDLAEALAIVATTDGHDGVTYHLSGDTEFTYDDIANAMGAVLEREVRYLPVTGDELRAILVGTGMDVPMADFLVELDRTIAAGTYARVGDDLTRILRRPTTSLVAGMTT